MSQGWRATSILSILVKGRKWFLPEEIAPSHAELDHALQSLEAQFLRSGRRWERLAFDETSNFDRWNEVIEALKDLQRKLEQQIQALLTHPHQ